MQEAASLSFTFIQWATIGALWGVVISSVYMLRAYRHVFFGPLPDKFREQTDAGIGTRWPLVVLLGCLMIVGFYPSALVNLIKPSLAPAIARVAQK